MEALERALQFESLEWFKLAEAEICCSSNLELVPYKKRNWNKICSSFELKLGRANIKAGTSAH